MADTYDFYPIDFSQGGHPCLPNTLNFLELSHDIKPLAEVL